jgi:hypothetical protein
VPFTSKDFPWRDNAECRHCHTLVVVGGFHAGFSDSDPLYCSRCENSLIIKRWDCFLPAPPPSYSNTQDYARELLPYWTAIEATLAGCPCGGTFRFLNSPRCPKCHDLLLGDLYQDKPILKLNDLRPIIPRAVADAAKWTKKTRLDAGKGCGRGMWKGVTRPTKCDE